MFLNTLVPLLELTRGGYVECTHFGAIAVVNARGKVLAQAGDADFVTFTRSTLKAFQALPFVEAGGVQRFGFTTPEVAMLCASHNGEAKHVEAVESMLMKSGSSYQRLRCGCGIPGVYSLMDKSPPEGLQFDERHHNCSGKHAGFVAHCIG
jgi:L-asparaginase II